MAETKQSQYLQAGAPAACFLPSCHKPFAGSCYRGDDDRFYCSAECATRAEDLDFAHIEPFTKAAGR